MTHILRIEHPVPDFGGWKKAFDSDPARRQASGVRRYRVIRPVDDSKFAIVDLEFESRAEADSFLGKLKGLWSRVEGSVMNSPQARIFELESAIEY
ncbi:MAG: hypothetical protein ABI681_06460 [Gemmatimonadales bacterium]